MPDHVYVTVYIRISAVSYEIAKNQKFNVCDFVYMEIPKLMAFRNKCIGGIKNKFISGWST